MTVIEQLAAWSAQARSFSAPVMQIASRSLEDVVACQLAGIEAEASRRVRDALSRWAGSGQADVIGGARLTAPMAALANGTLAHALDYDDLSVEVANHPSAAIVPALFALAQETGASGETLMNAFATGLELNCRVALGVMRAHSTLGWHTTSTIGSIAAAGACARLLALDELQTAHALSLAASHAAGMKSQFGSLAKPMHAGLAAQHGVQAAVLAASGMQGGLDVLEAPMGFRDLYGGSAGPGWARLDMLAQGPLLIEQQGVALKRFPCCDAAHRSIDCLLELRAEQAFGADDVQDITATVGLLNYRNLRWADPATPNEAKFSMQYCLAVALLHGTVALRDFTPEAVARPPVRELFSRIHLRHHEDAGAPPPHEVRVRLRDGRELVRTRAHQVGSAHEPLTEGDRERKFLECAAPCLSPAQARDLRARLATFRDAPDAGAVVVSINAAQAARAA